MTRSPSARLVTFCADGGDAAGGFVAHYDRRNAATGGAVVAVDVTAADAARRHLNQHFIRERSGLRKISNFQMVVFRKEKSFHFVRALT